MNNQTQSRSANGYTAKGTGVLIAVLLCVLFSLGAMPVQAFDCVLDEDGDGIGDGTSGASSSTFSTRLACGEDASAAGGTSTALGPFASAAGDFSTAVGNMVSSAGADSTALGTFASAAGTQSTAVGRSASAAGTGSTAVGQDAEVDDMSTDAVALGHDAKIVNASGGIAIGADLNGDDTGATATAPGAIAIGADVVADKAHTMTVGVPVEVRRDDGTTQVLVNEKSAGNAVRTLFNVVCDTCTPGFRFNQLLPSNNTWNFRMLQSGNFSVDDPATVGKEAEFRSGGDLKIAGTLIQSSSRTLKTDIRQIEAEEVLTRLEQLPISEWSYKKDNGRVKHIGPMAEDFHALFKVGVDNKSISSLDTSGVALAAIKSLHQENKQLKADTDQALTYILNKIGELPITQWSYKKDNGKIDHIGPVSEDFHHMFGLGENNKGISSVDTSGVALAAIKALKTENDIKTQEIAQLKAQNAVLINRLSAIETKYAEIDDIKQKLLAITAMYYGDQNAQQIASE